MGQIVLLMTEALTEEVFANQGRRRRPTGLLISLRRTQGPLSWYKICWGLETKSGGNLKYKWATFVTEALPEDLIIALHPSVLIK